MVRVRFNDAERALLAESRADGRVLDWRNGPAWGQQIRIVGQARKDESGKDYSLGEILRTRGFMQAGQTVSVYPGSVRALPVAAGAPGERSTGRAATDRADQDQTATDGDSAESRLTEVPGPGRGPGVEQALQLDLGLGPAADSDGPPAPTPDPLDPAAPAASRDYEALQILTRLHYDGHHLIAMSDKQGQRAVAWLAAAGLVSSRLGEHGDAVLAGTEAGERAIRAHVDQLEATLRRPVDVDLGDLIRPPGRPGSVLQVRQVRRDGDVVRVSGMFIDAHQAGLPGQIDWHLNGREDGWPSVPLSRDPRDGERIAHLNSVPGEYLLALARLQAVDTRLGVTRPYFRQAVELIHDAMAAGAPPQEGLPRVAAHLRAVADRPTGTATQRRDLPPERADGIRRLAAELDQVITEGQASGGVPTPAVHGPSVQSEPSSEAIGPAAAAEVAEQIRTTGDELMTAGQPPVEHGTGAAGAPVTDPQVSAGREDVGQAAPAAAAGDPIEASARRYAGWFAYHAKIDAAVTSWNGITSADRRRQLRDHGVRAPAGYAWGRDHGLHPGPAAAAGTSVGASAAGREAVGTDRDDRSRDTAVPAVGQHEAIGVTDGRDEQGIRDPGRGALAQVPADRLRADPDAGPAGLLPGAGDAGPRPDRGPGGETGGPGPAGGERPGQAGPTQRGQGDGRGAGGPGTAPARPGEPAADLARPGHTGPGGAGGAAGDGLTVGRPVAVSRFAPRGQDDLAPAGEKAKAQANVAALQVLRGLQAEQRAATVDEQRVLARWSGWGALAEQVFGANPAHVEAFAEERAALQDLLSGQDREAALDSTLNAHFTHAGIATAIWEALGDLGVSRGQVLEPGCGSGNFIGMAPDGVQMVGVELDPTTAAIATALYPDAVVVNQDLTEFTVPGNTFDAVVGNVPFGTRRPFDPAHNPGRQLSLHNYVIAKALGQTRPGGVVAVITSRYTLDSLDEKARRILNDRACFLGAVRLPSGAHQDAAGTKVVTDVVLLRRRLPNEIPDRDETWLRTRPLPAPDAGHPAASIDPDPDADPDAAGEPGAGGIAVNDYFAEHPEQVLGWMSVGRGNRGRPDLVVAGEVGDVAEQLRAALARVVDQARESNRTQTARTDEPTPVREILAARSDLPEGQLVRHGDGFALVESGHLVDVPVPRARVDELVDLLALRDASVVMLEADQSSTEDTDASRAARARANQLYDGYRARYGPINRGRWVRTTPKNVILDRPESVPIGDLRASDIIRWPGTDKNGRARRAVVDHVGDNGAVTVNVVGVQGRQREQRVPAEMATATKLGARHQQRRFVRELPGVFDLDDRASLVLALESYDQESGQAEKTTLLTERLVRKPPEPGTVTDPDDALVIVLDERGSVDVAAVAALMGTDEVTALQRLGTRVFADHETGSLVPAVDYLSGDVRAKLAAAEAGLQGDPALQVNVDALREVLPAWKHADEIKAYPGASWIPVSDLQAFLAETLQDDGVQVTHEQDEGWRVQAGRRRSQSDPLTTSEWGTAHHDAYDVFEAMLRRGKLTVRNEDGGVDKEATAAAYAAADRIRVRFEEWVWENPERGDRLETIYNNQLNSLVPPCYSTKPLHPPGMTGLITLAGHQNAAVRRITAEAAVLVTHKVGAGKTYTLVAGLMELKRLGHIRKPMLVVPNHLKEQWQRDWLTLYPNARVLAASTEDLNRVGRDRFLGRAATGDWDAVIVTQEVFRSIPVSRSTAHHYVETELAVFEKEIRQIEQDGADQRTVKEERERLTRRRDKVEESLASADASAWTFEMLGVDHIGIDEMHGYKNLARVSGSAEHSLEGSIRSMDLHVKAGWLWRTSESGRVLTGATATPLLNSFGEIHTWMRYFRPSSPMSQMAFDTFLANYALSSVKYEMTASGTREAKDRVRDYRNFSGVMRGWANFADVAELDLDVPDIDGGQPENIIIPASDWLVSEYLPRLAERAQAIQGRPRAKGQDTMPVILSDGLAAALDPRAVGGPDIGELGKIAWAARNAAEIYHQTRANRYDDPLTRTEHPTPGAFQFMFLDLGTPGASKRYAATMAKIERAELAALHQLPDDPPVDVPVRVSEQVGFEAYQELKAQLVDLGVPEKAIVFMHDAGGKDAKKAAIYRAAREGEIAILIGSTQLMGTGVNAQTRAVALHNVDCPYRAADLEQRNGRIQRQFNQNSVVRILNYATADSHDEVKWQAVQRKAQLLGRVAAGDLTINEITELGDDLGIEEMTAQLSGSPAKIDKSRVEQELLTVAAARKAFHRAQDNAGFARLTNRAQAAAVRQRLDRLDEAIPRLTRRAGAPVGGYTATIAGREVSVRADANADLRAAIAARVGAHRGMTAGKRFTLGVFGGFEVLAQVVPLSRGHQVEMRFPDLPDIDLSPVEAGKNNSTDYVARIVNALDRLEPLRPALQAMLPGLERNITNAENMLGRAFAAEDRYQALMRRAERLTALVAWEDDPARSGDEAPPASLTSDPPEVVAVLGELRAQNTTKERSAAVSLANLAADGQRIPRQTSRMRWLAELQTAAGPAANAVLATPATQLAGPEPGAHLQRVSPTLTQVQVESAGADGETVEHRPLYSVQATRDGHWAVFAPGQPDPLVTQDTREIAETWALQHARTGAPPWDPTPTHRGPQKPTRGVAPDQSPAPRLPAGEPDHDTTAPGPGQRPQAHPAEPAQAPPQTAAAGADRSSAGQSNPGAVESAQAEDAARRAAAATDVGEDHAAATQTAPTVRPAGRPDPQIAGTQLDDAASEHLPGPSTDTDPARAATPAPHPATRGEVAELVIEHTAGGSLVFGTAKGDAAVRQALHDTGWKWSRRVGTELGYEGAWWLSRKAGHGLRTGSVNRLRTRLQDLGRGYRYVETQEWRQELGGPAAQSPRPPGEEGTQEPLAPEMTPIATDAASRGESVGPQAHEAGEQASTAATADPQPALEVPGPPGSATVTAMRPLATPTLAQLDRAAEEIGPAVQERRAAGEAVETTSTTDSVLGDPHDGIDLPPAAPALSAVVQSLTNHAFRSGFTPVVEDPDPEFDGEFAVALLDPSGEQALLLTVSPDQSRLTLHGLPDREVNGFTTEVHPPTHPDAIRTAITDHGARLRASIAPGPSPQAGIGAVLTGRRDQPPGVDTGPEPVGPASDPDQAVSPNETARKKAQASAGAAPPAEPEPAEPEPAEPEPAEPEPAEPEPAEPEPAEPEPEPAEPEPAEPEPAEPSPVDPADPGAARQGAAAGPVQAAADLASQPQMLAESDPTPTAQDSDQEILASALATVQELVPGAEQVLLTTSDQSDSGFVLRDVILRGGTSLASADPELLVETSDATWPTLGGLSWDGVVGEDRRGNATLTLVPEPAAPDEPAPNAPGDDVAVGLHDGVDAHPGRDVTPRTGPAAKATSATADDPRSESFPGDGPMSGTPAATAETDQPAAEVESVGPPATGVVQAAAPVPSRSAFAPFAAAEQVLIRQSVEDWTGYYHRGRLRLPRAQAIRATVEGHLERLTGTHSLDEVAAAVVEHLHTNPQILTRTVRQEERERRSADRGERALPLNQAALDAYRAGDYPTALHHIGQAELIDPKGRDYQRVRDVIEAEAAATPTDGPGLVAPPTGEQRTPGVAAGPIGSQDGSAGSGQGELPGAGATTAAAVVEPQSLTGASGQAATTATGHDGPQTPEEVAMATQPQIVAPPAGGTTLTGPAPDGDQPDPNPGAVPAPDVPGTDTASGSGGQDDPPAPVAQPGASTGPDPGEALPLGPLVRGHDADLQAAVVAATTAPPPGPAVAPDHGAEGARRSPDGQGPRPAAAITTSPGTGSRPPGRPDPDPAGGEPGQGDSAAAIRDRVAAGDAGVRELRADLASVRQSLDRALAERPRVRSGAELSVGEAALQLLDAAYAQAGRRLAPYAQTKTWQQITRVWQATSEAWKQVRELVTRQGFRQTAEQLLRTLATRAADAIAGLAERAVSGLGAEALLAGPARYALTHLATTARDVAAKVRPLTPAAADLRATNTRVQDEYRQAQAAVDTKYRQMQAAVDAAFAEMLRPGTDAPTTPPQSHLQRGQQPGQHPDQERDGTAPGPRSGPARAGTPGEEQTPAMHRWAATVGVIDEDLLREPGYRRLATTLDRAQAAGQNVATLLPQLVAQGRWEDGAGTDALRTRVITACPDARGPRATAAMATVGARPGASRPPERPPVPVPARPAPRR